MPAKKKAKSKLPSKKILLVSALTVLVGIATWILLWNINHKRDQRQKEERLNNAAVVLDDLAGRLKSVIPSLGEIKRDAVCDRTSEKFGDGYIICGQRITGSGHVSSDAEIVRLPSDIASMVNKTPGLSLETPNGLSNISRSNVMSGIAEIKVSGESKSCQALLTAFTYNAVRENDRGNYEYEIRCLESQLDKYIYPEGSF